MSLQVRCPAKINLFLAVGPPDASGYHPLRTVFQAVDLCDTLWIAPAATDSLEVIGAELPADNTLTKTLRLARQIGAIPPVALRLEKRIPIEAGLGGGSSDAAGLLRGLERLFPGGVPDSADVARQAGADVPFFLVGGRARGEGYGERLTPLPDDAARWVLIVKPDLGVSTPEAYRRLDAAPRAWREFPADPWELYNDFERVAPCLCGDLAERMQVHGASAAQLSGSGSAVFGLFPDSGTAESARNALFKEGFPPGWVVQTLSREASLWMS